MIRFIDKHTMFFSSFINKINYHFPNVCNVSVRFTRQYHATQKLMSPILNVSPLVSLYDVKPSIRVEGLEPLKQITLKAQMREDKGKLLYSNAHYIADDNGVVDVGVSPSLNGTYKGIFPTGLLSSLKIASGNFEFGRIHKNNMHEPVKIRISVLDGHKPIEVDEGEIDSVELHRHLIAKGVQRIPVKEGRVRGVLYIPEGDGPFPGVIDMFGATGSLFESRAALNAARGIASLALAYFHYDDIPVEQIHNQDLAYVEEAIEYLLSHPKVNGNRCGIIGNCFGGYLAYHMSLHLSKVKAVFVINAPPNPFWSDLKYKGKVVADTPKNVKAYVRKDSDGTYTSDESFNKLLNNVTSIHVEAFNNTLDDQHFAFAMGEHDCYQFHVGWQNFSQLLKEKNKRNFTLKTYPKAGHLVHPPYTPFTSIAFAQIWSQDPELRNGFLLNLGGESRETVDMQEDVWQWMFSFFRKHLGVDEKN